MDDLLERMSRAMEPEVWLAIDRGTAHYSARERFLQKARKGLEALREPTETMIKGGGQQIPWEAGWGSPDEQIKAAWHAMIDAALHQHREG